MSSPYLKQGAVYPFCKGCGHHHYVTHLDGAFASIDLDPQHCCIVSDIGCIGILDSLFSTPHTFHTTHGRSTAFATGIELADGILHDSKLKSVVVIGDGGATIGLLHIVNAALMNVDVTVLVANNMLYGMTGGQNSGFSPLDFVTATTPGGNIVPPMDICGITKNCGAEFVARISATDKDLSSVIAAAIAHPGFALVEIMELCTEYAVGKNQITGKTVAALSEGYEAPMPITPKREEFSTLYRSKVLRTPGPAQDDSIPKKFSTSFTGTQRWVIAGTAGERVQLASFLLMRAAIASGLHATQKNDNPVTQGTGFSLSEVCISSGPIHYTGIDTPDVVIVASADGLKEVTANGTLRRCNASSLVIVDDSLALPPLNGRIVRIPLRSLCTPSRAALSAVAAAAASGTMIPAEAMRDAVVWKYKEKAALFAADIQKLQPYLAHVPETQP